MGSAVRINPLYLTFTVGLFGYTFITAARVLLPLYALHLGAGPSEVGLLAAMLYVFPLLLSWPIGVMCDRVGARWLLLACLLSGGVGLLLPYFRPGMPAIYAAGVLSGLCYLCNVLLQNLVGLLSAPHERARNAANSSLVGSTTNVLGPLIAGFAIDYSGYGPACLYILALSLAAAALVIIFGGVLPKPRPATPEAGPSSAPALRRRLVDKTMLGIITTGAIAHIGQDLYTIYVSLYGHGIGLSASVIGSVMSSIFVASFLVRVILPNLIKRLGEDRLLLVAFLASAVGFALLPFFQNPWALSAISAVFGLGMGCAQPVTMVLLLSACPEGRSGETMGLRQTVNNVARTATLPVFGFIAGVTGLMAVFLLSAVLMGAAGAITRLMAAPPGDRPTP